MQSLLAFEAAARHLNFTKAAQELNLTQTAISHQIKNLEKLLGIKLFVRQRNTLTLTSAAREYLHSISEAINLVSSATDITRKDKQSTMLNIVCLPTYATQCLLPVLPEFQQLHPHITINLRTSSELSEFDRANYDVAIRYGSGMWTGTQSELLHEEEFFPVCAPHLLESKSLLTERQLLTQLPQIRTYFYSMYQDDWPTWLKAAGHSGVQFSSTSVFHMQLASLGAALAGSGIAIGRTPLIDRHLLEGTLIAPFKTRIKSRSAYFLSSPSGRAALQKVKLFRQWALHRLGGQTTSAAHHPKTITPPFDEVIVEAENFKPVAALLAEWQARSPDKYALIDVSNDRRITFNELAALVDTAAHQLIRQGVTAGDNVIVFMNDCLEKIVIWLALWRVAAVVCPIDLSRLRSTAIASVCDTLDPRHIIYDADSETPNIPESMLTRLLRTGRLEPTNKSSDSYDIVFNAQTTDGPGLLPEGAQITDIAAICGTSGTTGEPKLIVYDHATYWLNAEAIVERLTLTSNDRMLEYRSFDWSSAQILSLMPFLKTGLTLHIAPQFSLSSFAQWVAQYQLSVSVGVPAVINLLLQKPEEIRPADLASLRYITCSTAPLPIAQWIRFEQIFRVRLLNIYGSSEAGWICSNRSESMSIGTVGYPMPGVSVDIVNDHGRTCPTGVTGHLMVQGPALAVGLLQPDGKVEKIRGKRLATNDLGYIDQSGHIHITGRVDDVIIRGGVKIYPRNIEEVLLAHPEVQDAAVVGAPDDIYGQSPVCFLVPRSDVTKDELRAYCQRNLPRELVPTDMVIVQKLPRNTRGKLIRSKLLEDWRSTSSKQRT